MSRDGPGDGQLGDRVLPPHRCVVALEVVITHGEISRCPFIYFITPLQIP